MRRAYSLCLQVLSFSLLLVLSTGASYAALLHDVAHEHEHHAHHHCASYEATSKIALLGFTQPQPALFFRLEHIIQDRPLAIMASACPRPKARAPPRA